MLGRKDDPDEEDAEQTGYDGNARDDRRGTEIMGLRLGREIADLVPSELVPLMDDELSVIFDLKFIEERLLAFTREDDVETGSGDDLRSGHGLGPVILVVDTSGSMTGDRLFYAKALAFTIATRAAEQRRDVFRIDFNVDTRCTDMSPRTSAEQLLDFLGTEADGGTDAGPALQEAVKVTEKERYGMADIVVISDLELDMYCFRRDDPSMKSLRERGCRVHAVAVMSNHRYDRDPFDSCWEVTAMPGKRGSRRFEKASSRAKKTVR
jgi:uncharacterized protein with von Willebrand factor type A (vWA) domain